MPVTFNIEWTAVVIGWTIILMTLSITKLKLHRVGGGIYSMKKTKLPLNIWIMRAITLIYILIVANIAFLARIPLLDNIFLNISDTSNYIYIAIGIIIFVLALILFISARLALGSNWTWGGDLIGDRNQLIKKGPYSKIRHPQYTSYFLAGVASGLILVDAHILFFMILLIPIIFWKAKVDEEFLSSLFHEYEKYKKQTRMFI